MSNDGSAAERDIVRKLARGSLLSRLRKSRQPLKLVAVPRDHVHGDRQRGDALLAGRFTVGTDTLPLTDLDFGEVGAAGRWPSSSRAFPGSATSPPPRRARKARGSPKRWQGAGCSPMALGSTRPGRPICGASASSSGPLMRPTSCRAPTAAIARPCSTRLRAAPGTSISTADKAPPGLPRVTAWCGVVAAGLLVQGGMSRVARGEAGLARALAAAQFDDGGLVSRSPFEQVLLVDRLGLLRACYQAAKAIVPDGIEAAASASLAALHGVTMGDGALSSWQGCNPGEPARLSALIEGCGMRARPLRQARGWGYQRLSALGTVLVLDAAPPPAQKARVAVRPRPWRSNCRTVCSASWSIAAARGRYRPTFLTRWLRASHDRGAQHLGARRHQFDQHPARRVARQGRRGRRRSTAARTMTPAASKPATTAMSAPSAWSTSAA